MPATVDDFIKNFGGAGSLDDRRAETLLRTIDDRIGEDPADRLLEEVLHGSVALLELGRDVVNEVRVLRLGVRAARVEAQLSGEHVQLAQHEISEVVVLHHPVDDVVQVVA